MWVNATVDCHVVTNEEKALNLHVTATEDGEFLDMRCLLTMEDGTKAELTTHIHVDHAPGLDMALRRLAALAQGAWVPKG